MDNDKTSARAARRLLDARIRTDWDWPNPPLPSASDEDIRNVVEFRERYYATTSPSTSDAESEENGRDSYKFDSPDAVGTAVMDKARDKKRKRRVLLEKEMEWNEGLSCFVRRRDVWTGAEAVRKFGTNTNIKHTSNGPLTAADPQEEELIPLPPSLLSGNPIRTSITPKIYPEIYNKVVVTGRTPSVPINLSDMTRALVQGWKDSGEWPPRSGPLDPLVGRKKGSAAGVGGSGTAGPFLSHHPHVKKGMESVKRIFHFNGG
ncbi:hypothetical protein GQ43DRAFT_396289, partial [Delitschia confertaspora ATCC 74209]